VKIYGYNFVETVLFSHSYNYMNIFASMNISTGIFEFTRYGVECDSYESENI